MYGIISETLLAAQHSSSVWLFQNGFESSVMPKSTVRSGREVESILPYRHNDPSYGVVSAADQYGDGVGLPTL
jgi:hypothetical protein